MQPMRTTSIRTFKAFSTNGIVALGLALVAASCTTTRPPAADAPAGMIYHEDSHLQNVWLVEGFDFNGYHSLYIGPTDAQIPNLSKADEVKMLEWSKGVVRDEFTRAIRTNGVFALVTTNESEIRPDTRTLKLESCIVEFAKGSGAARFWAGEFGAGQPVLRVRGKLRDGDRVMFQFESYRSGDSAAARLDPGWTPEERLQSRDILDLAKDLAEFVVQTSKHQPRK